MLPGKKYAPDDFLWMAWKRKWFILIPTIVIAAGTFTWSYFLPNRFRSEATIVIVPQRVPESYVRSTVTTEVDDRIQMISQQLLSRARLERIVNEFDLYKKERETQIMEDVIERMRLFDISIRPVSPSRRGNQASSFKVSFDAPQPRTAMLVAERLASMFVQENLQDREVLADSTNQFLQAQLEDAKRRLVEHETKFEEFRRRNAGRLPTQMQSNLQMMQQKQAQLQANSDGANKDRDRLTAIEALIAEAAAAPPEVRAAGSAPGNAPGTPAQQLEGARVALRNLELRLKPDHPDVKQAKQIIRELEAKAEAEALAASVSADPGAVVPAGQSAAATSRIAALRLEARDIRARLETRKADDARLQSELASYASRVEASPGLESELTELMRDYSTINEQYTTLLRKAEESRIAVNLERRQIGEQFRIIDGARLPERPFSPNRTRYNLMGLLGGLALGLALAALLEYRDTTLKTDDDVVTSLALPVLAVIPAMVTARERKRLRRRRVALAFSASMASLVLVAVVVWRLRLLEGWVR
jgi:polysaccharide chain length determinant protein (PEP-CTERM system associated)